MKIEIVQNPKQGIEAAKRILYKTVDSKTALFLSGGTTPKPFYKALSEEKKLKVGAVAMVDERFGQYLHKDTNERMIKETGLISYISQENIPFYGILQEPSRHSGKRSPVPDGTGRSASRISIVERDFGQARLASRAKRARMTLKKVAEDYDKTVRSLFKKFQKHVAIMGIGEDGHTAGLPARSQKSIQRPPQDKNQKYVTEVKDFPGEFRERITLTFRALEKMDLLIVLVFGSKKKNALKLMFTQGLEEEVPARFFNRPDISKKTIVITDQRM